MNGDNDQQTYALYKGEKKLAVGTADEIAKELNIKRTTVLFYKEPSYLKRGRNNGNKRELIMLD